ncbi:MAG: adenine phosphoribosyltransferase [Spirochaetia bacterium]
MSFNLDATIRKVADFPKPGILFYDITGIVSNPEAFAYCIDRMLGLYSDKNIEAVAAIDSRGFLFAAPFAHKLGLPIILVRKNGKLPGETYKQSYMLEYGEDAIEIKKDDLDQKRRILVVDDLIATGGTLKATIDIIESAGSSVAGVFAVIGLPFLNYQKTLKDVPVNTLIEYHGE